MNILRTAGKKLRDWRVPPLDWLEQRYSVTDDLPLRTTMPFLAVIGPPRVGSTLMYQLLLSHFRFFYFDNLQHGLLRYPNLAFGLSQYLSPMKNRRTNLRSDHGFVDGIFGASEANFFWPHWFDMNMTQLSVRPHPDRQGHALQFFDRVHRILPLPLTNSYNPHAFYMREVAALFSDVVFIALRRDPLANGLSILRARRQLRQHVREWWSIQPTECVGISHLDEYTQIARQLRFTYHAIHCQRASNPQLKVIDVDYDELCANPAAAMTQIAAGCHEHRFRLIPREITTPTVALSRRTIQHDAETQQMAAALVSAGIGSLPPGY